MDLDYVFLKIIFCLYWYTQISSLSNYNRYHRPHQGPCADAPEVSLEVLQVTESSADVQTTSSVNWQYKISSKKIRAAVLLQLKPSCVSTFVVLPALALGLWYNPFPSSFVLTLILTWSCDELAQAKKISKCFLLVLFSLIRTVSC